MANGTPETVTEKCVEALDILAPGGGFILGPGCALPATTPDENIDALIEAAKKHGRYPARVFQRMAREVRLREEWLKR
jgi:uroporphyrinogen decarboxylase